MITIELLYTRRYLEKEYIQHFLEEEYIYVNFLRYFCFQSKPFFILYLLQTVVNNSFWNVVCRHVRLSEGGCIYQREQNESSG